MWKLGVRYGARQLLSSVQALCLLTMVVSEPFYQRRDHLDQSRYLTVHNDNVVKDRNDAEFVLSKYGYLRCRINRKRREAGYYGRGGRAHLHHFAGGAGAELGTDFNPISHFWPPELEGGVAWCAEDEVQKAIREYQRTYNLPPTGRLDEETKTLMSTSRCGNKDNAKEEDGASTTTSSSSSSSSPTSPSTTTTTTTTPSPPAPPPPVSDNVQLSSSSSSSQHHHHKHHKHHKRDDANRSGDVGAAKRLWKRAVNRIRHDDPSQLLRLLKGATQTTALSRHRRHLHDYIHRLSRADPRLLAPWTEEERAQAEDSIQVKSRARRSIQVTATREEQDLMNLVGLQVSEHHTGVEAEQQEPEGQGVNAEMFNKDIIRWRLLTTGYSTRIPVEDQRATLDLAFRMWSEVIPLRFVEDTDSDIHTVDIEVAFGRGAHQNCGHDFDGNGGEIAHSRQAGNVHFDDEENFKSIRSYTPDGIYLLRVAVHEIGHVLGLAHTNKSQSIMYAIYHGAELSPEFELSRDDRKEVQKIYGVCKGEFSTVFDWVRKRPDNQFIYNTYFFRENHYWMYENHANRTRYGDPLYIAREWKGVPDGADGYLHVWYFSGTEIVDQAFFFKGEEYYKYNSENDEVMEGWPRRIRDDFGPKPGQSVGVPDNLDTVFFDMRDKNIYFFKDDMVYVYDPKEPEEERGCCVRIRRIQEEFPSAPDGGLALPDSLDAAYYSYGDKIQYFIKGENLWRNRVFDPRQRRIVNSIEFLGKWYERWMDICDVQAH